MPNLTRHYTKLNQFCMGTRYDALSITKYYKISISIRINLSALKMYIFS